MEHLTRSRAAEIMRLCLIEMENIGSLIGSFDFEQAIVAVEKWPTRDLKSQAIDALQRFKKIREIETPRGKISRMLIIKTMLCVAETQEGPIE